MSPRDAILAAVRRNLPRPAVPLPEVPGTDRKGIAGGLGYKEHFNRLPEVPGFPDEGEPLDLVNVDEMVRQHRGRLGSSLTKWEILPVSAEKALVIIATLVESHALIMPFEGTNKIDFTATSAKSVNDLQISQHYWVL